MRFQIVSTLLFAASALAARQCHEVPDTTSTVPAVPTTPTTPTEPTEPTTPTVPTTVPTTPTTPGNGGKDVTVIQADNACGNDLELHCCEDEQSFEGLGLLSSLLVGGAGLFNGCSKLSIAGLINVGDLLGSHCKQTAVCCHGGETTQNGLINVAIPCIAIGGLL